MLSVYDSLKELEKAYLKLRASGDYAGAKAVRLHMLKIIRKRGVRV